MIGNLNKLLFLDIETVGGYKSLDDLNNRDKQLYKVWEESGNDYFKRSYPEDFKLSSSETYEKRASLLAEFGKIICISVGFILPDGNIKIDTFSGLEKELLIKCKDLLNRVDNLGFNLCGHNIKNFDLPYIGKRMLVNGISVPNLIPTYKIKPWEARVLDTKELWNFNSYRGLSSLELVCATLDIPNPKDNEVSGSNMHNYFYNNGDMKKIIKYCEEDVKSLIKFIKKIEKI
tara:strand:+ start:244 stop:939 length:696 start_codon:yes stop_codon:yes gene_type:complete